MLSTLKDIIRGMIIGVANVIPGVSGGTMAVSMGVYQKIIDSINNIKSDFKNSIKNLWPFLVGMVLGIVCLSFIINFLLTNYEIPTVFGFIGLVIGGVPAIINKLDDKRIKITHIIAFIFTLLIIILPSIISMQTEPLKEIPISFFNIIILLILGIVSSSAMVVPGVSGSMILMMLGYYDIIISTIKNTVTYLLKFDISSAINGVLLLFPFGIGVILGIIIITKIISYLLNKFPNASYWGILGLVSASPFAIIAKISTSLSNISLATWIISILTMTIGCLVAKKLGDNN